MGEVQTHGSMGTLELGSVLWGLSRWSSVETDAGMAVIRVAAPQFGGRVMLHGMSIVGEGDQQMTIVHQWHTLPDRMRSRAHGADDEEHAVARYRLDDAGMSAEILGVDPESPEAVRAYQSLHELEQLGHGLNRPQHWRSAQEEMRRLVDEGHTLDATPALVAASEFILASELAH